MSYPGIQNKGVEVEVLKNPINKQVKNKQKTSLSAVEINHFEMMEIIRNNE